MCVDVCVIFSYKYLICFSYTYERGGLQGDQGRERKREGRKEKRERREKGGGRRKEKMGRGDGHHLVPTSLFFGH